MWCWKSLGSGNYWSTGDGFICLEGWLNGVRKLHGNSFPFHKDFQDFLSFILKFCFVLGPTKLFLDPGSDHHRWVLWLGRVYGRILLSWWNVVELILACGWMFLFHVIHKLVLLSVSSRVGFLHSSSNSEYTVICIKCFCLVV